MKRENEFSCLFGLYQAIRNNIVAKKTTELVLSFLKKATKLVFFWPNMGQFCFKSSSLRTFHTFGAAKEKDHPPYNCKLIFGFANKFLLYDLKPLENR